MPHPSRHPQPGSSPHPEPWEQRSRPKHLDLKQLCQERSRGLPAENENSSRDATPGNSDWGDLLLLLQFLVFLLVLPQFCTSAVSTPSLQGCAGWIFPVIQGGKKGEGEEMQSREQEEPGPPRLLGVTIALSDLNISH